MPGGSVPGNLFYRLDFLASGPFSIFRRTVTLGTLVGIWGLADSVRGNLLSGAASTPKLRSLPSTNSGFACRLGPVDSLAVVSGFRIAPNCLAGGIDRGLYFGVTLPRFAGVSTEV